MNDKKIWLEQIQNNNKQRGLEQGARARRRGGGVQKNQKINKRGDIC